jgi:hypothetical protein
MGFISYSVSRMLYASYEKNHTSVETFIWDTYIKLKPCFPKMITKFSFAYKIVKLVMLLSSLGMVPDRPGLFVNVLHKFAHKIIKTCG